MNRPVATKSTLFETIELINSGSIDRAESICRAAVERNDRDVNMTALLGATLFKAGKIEEAERWLRHTMRIAPNFAKPWSDLGQLLVDTHRHAEALAVLENAVRLEPKEDSAWFNLGKARAMLGRGREADEAFERSFELNPRRKALAHAAELQQSGDWAESERLTREILRSEPKNVNALRLLAACSCEAGRTREAEKLLRQAISQAPDFIEARLDLGRLFKDQNLTWVPGLIFCFPGSALETICGQDTWRST